jgi:prophage tail gpP-like protein
MSADEVRLDIGGRRFTGWTGCTIDMAIDTLADAFSVSGPFNPDRSDLREAFRPFGYQDVKLYIDDDLLLTGRIDKVEPSVSASERVLTVQGRSLPGVLVDCSIEDAAEMYGLHFSEIAAQVCRPFGIRVRADNDTNALDIARPEYGQSVYDFLNSLAAPRNLFLNSSYDGRLVITWGRAIVARGAVAALAEGRAPLLSVGASFDGTARYSRYIRSTQFAGIEDIRGEATDSAIGIYRPSVAALGDADTDPRVSAARARTAAFAGAVAVQVAVAGWRRPDGLRWAERQKVTLHAPGAFILRETEFLVAGVSLKLDASSGRTADLRLVLPQTYAGEMPEVLPRA